MKSRLMKCGALLALALVAMVLHLGTASASDGHDDHEHTEEVVVKEGHEHETPEQHAEHEHEEDHEGHAHGGPVWDSYWSLMTDPGHWLFEATTDLFFGILIAAGAWLMAMMRVKDWVDQFKGEIISEHDAEFHPGEHDHG